MSVIILTQQIMKQIIHLGKLLVNPEASQHVDRIPLSTIQGKEDFLKL